MEYVLTKCIDSSVQELKNLRIRYSSELSSIELELIGQAPRSEFLWICKTHWSRSTLKKGAKVSITI